MNRGLTTGYFNLERGVRQGDPLSPALFILGLEVLLLSINQNDTIKGIKLIDTIVKNSAFADDLTCFMADELSVKNLFSLLDSFYAISGLAINLSKTEAMWLGRWSDRFEKPFKISWPNSIKIVGIHFSYNADLAYKLNMSGPLKSAKRLLNLWQSRGLTLIGKLQIVKSLIIPKFLYIFNLITVKSCDIKTINGLLYRFIWKGPDRIS